MQDAEYYDKKKARSRNALFKSQTCNSSALFLERHVMRETAKYSRHESNGPSKHVRQKIHPV